MGTRGTAGEGAGAREGYAVPGSVMQCLHLTRAQLKEYISSRRFVILGGLIVAINLIIAIVTARYQSSIVTDNLSFYGRFWGNGANAVIVLLAVFFGGDGIAGEFQNKTGYFLMGLPIRRATVYIGKYVAAFLASLAILLVFLLLLILDAALYFGLGALPWQLGLSFLIAVVYLASVLGVTFFFSSLFKTSAYGIVLTAVLFLVAFRLVQTLVEAFVGIEPWMIISYAQGTLGNVFNANIPWSWTGMVTTVHEGPPRAGRDVTSYTPGIYEGMAIMVVYFLVSAAVGLLIFEREEFS